MWELRVPRADFFVAFVARCLFHSFFFFNDTATTEIYTLSLHDALPISKASPSPSKSYFGVKISAKPACLNQASNFSVRSEEHTSELQSRLHLVCRLLLEKKKKTRSRSRSSPPATAAHP